MFYSTNDKLLSASFREVILNGQAPDGGLYMPKTLPRMALTTLEAFSNKTLQEVAYEVALAWIGNDIPHADLEWIIEKAISFDAPIVELSENLAVIELFQGPSLSFKDFGARFMARLIEYFLSENELHILVATSGDTGSAVGQAFLDIPGVTVWILYPKDKISLIQEKQLTTMGHNVRAFEIEGTFDDCQSIVKEAFRDPDLKLKMKLSSANSINLGRIIPQTFYFFYAIPRILNKSKGVTVSIPCGNYGNLMASLFAKRMGLTIEKVIASTNVNNSFPRYLKTGIFKPKPTLATLSNAIDIGNPNNFSRILDLYNREWRTIQKDVFGFSFSDEETLEAIKEIDQLYHYIADPHGAIAYLGAKTFLKSFSKSKVLFLETAHPAKFKDTVEMALGREIILPDNLKETLSKTKVATRLSKNFRDFKECLISYPN